MPATPVPNTLSWIYIYIYISNAKQTDLTCRIRFGMLKNKIKILINSPGALCSNTAIAYVASHSTMLSSFDYRPCLSHYYVVHHGWIGWRINYISSASCFSNVSKSLILRSKEIFDRTVWSSWAAVAAIQILAINYIHAIEITSMDIKQNMMIFESVCDRNMFLVIVWPCLDFHLRWKVTRKKRQVLQQKFKVGWLINLPTRGFM